ncbi:MAG: ATP-binding protein, partial [Saezia sp.]
LSMLIVLFICIGLAMMLSKSIKTVLHDLEPAQIAKLLEERNAILRTVREGIIAINKDGDVTLINKEARRLLKIPEQKWDDFASVMQHKIYEYIPNTRLEEVLKSGQSEYDCEQKLGDAVILTNRTPLVVNGQVVGAIATFRDMTEMRELAEKLTGASRYVDALRSQSHEFLNKLHVIQGLAYNHQREELLNYLNSVMKSREKEEKHIHEQIKEPIIAAFLASKFSRAKELGVRLQFFISGELHPIAHEHIIHSLVTVIGNLMDNALEAVDTVEEKNVDIRLEVNEQMLVFEVSDSGPGIEPDKIPKIFQKKYTTKGEYRGYGLFLVFAIVNELQG